MPCFYFSQCLETGIWSEGKELSIHFEHFLMMVGRRVWDGGVWGWRGAVRQCPKRLPTDFNF